MMQYGACTHLTTSVNPAASEELSRTRNVPSGRLENMAALHVVRNTTDVSPPQLELGAFSRNGAVVESGARR